jgi:hypothetical protein
MQHEITIIKIRTTKTGISFIKKLRAGIVKPILDQAVNKWLLYWDQYYDPWLTSLEYLEIPSRSISETLAEVVDQQLCKRWISARVTKKYYHVELRWYHQRLLDAIGSYEGQCRSRLFINNRCTNSSLDDEDLFKS